jgi:hypothetical protein
MFEKLEEEERLKKEARKKLVWMSGCIITAVVIVAALVYVIWRPRPKTQLPAQTPAAARHIPPPDPVHDLKIVHAIMGKDPSGIRVLWSVQLRNKSTVYTYSDIQYDATFIGPTGTTMAVNRDTIRDTIGPGEDKKIPPFMDGIYNAAASTYQFVITGAKATTE